MFKKLLATLSAFSVGALTTASVVACGPVTFTNLMNRTVDTTTYFGPLLTPVGTWSTGKSMQESDNMQTVNLVDALLQNDQYNNIIGDIADGWTGNADFTEWRVHINPETEWFDYHGDRIARDGQDRYQIRAHHVANTLRYTFNPGSMSQTLGLWTQLLRGADELGKKIVEIGNKYEEEGRNNPNWTPAEIRQNQIKQYLEADQMIINYIQGTLPNLTEEQQRARAEYQANNDVPYILAINDANDEVTFFMDAPTTFFDSVLTYVAFAPMPDEAVDWLGDLDPVYRINGSNYGSDYDKIYNSGAYYVTNSSVQNLTMIANENYRNQEDLHIRRIVLNYTRSRTPSIGRFQFEVGDLSSTILNSNDLGGWARYVGEDINNPIFEGAHPQSTPSLASRIMVYNYGRQQGDIAPEDNQLNWAMAQRSTRALIAYALDRQTYVRYWTRNVDLPAEEGQRPVSSLSLNRYTPLGLNSFLNEEGGGLADGNSSTGIPGINDRAADYVNLVTDQYLMQIANPNSQPLGITLDETEAERVENGQDLFYHNDYIAYNSLTDDTLKSEFVAAVQADDFNEKIQVLIRQILMDYQNEGLNFNANRRAQFRWVIPSLWLVTQFPLVIDMLRVFNEQIPNNPIQIVPAITGTTDEYQQQVAAKNFNMVLVGWSPDYSDPSTFLNTVQYAGDYKDYQNFESVMDRDAETGNLVPKNEHFAQLTEAVGTYTNSISQANVRIGFERYNGFAEAEARMLYNDLLFLPFYVNALGVQPSLGYVDQFTMSTLEVGTSRTKYLRWKMIPRLWTREMYQEALEAYEANRESVTNSIPNTLR